MLESTITSHCPAAVRRRGQSLAEQIEAHVTKGAAPSLRPAQICCACFHHLGHVDHDAAPARIASHELRRHRAAAAGQVEDEPLAAVGSAQAAGRDGPARRCTAPCGGRRRPWPAGSAAHAPGSSSAVVGRRRHRRAPAAHRVGQPRPVGGQLPSIAQGVAEVGLVAGQQVAARDGGAGHAPVAEREQAERPRAPRPGAGTPAARRPPARRPRRQAASPVRQSLEDAQLQRREQGLRKPAGRGQVLEVLRPANTQVPRPDAHEADLPRARCPRTWVVRRRKASDGQISASRPRSRRPRGRRDRGAPQG